MMINKRLIASLPQCKKYIFSNVAFQWIALTANIAMILSITFLLQALYEKTANYETLILTCAICTAAALVKFFCTKQSHVMSANTAISVKGELRQTMYKKLLCLNGGYNSQISTAELVQIFVEGVDQLENYFSSYLPQLIFSLLAPLTLFIVFGFINLLSAAVLLLCVPLIPITIAGVQTFAKKLLSKYWGQYAALGDSFLENLQGLTTLKIYQADKLRHKQMNMQSEKFRKITMKVLTMQLNSITVMDALAYGGAALGIVLATWQYNIGAVSLSEGLAIILLSADYYIPMRLLGSFFHIAMNGMAAGDKIFKLLDIEEPKNSGELPFLQAETLQLKNIRFSYDSSREILHGVNLCFQKNSLTAIVGESGSGKSTIAALISGRLKDYNGKITVGDINLNKIAIESLRQEITYVGYDSYLFKGSVRENLLMGCPAATAEQMYKVLSKVKLDRFINENQGLETQLYEQGANLSGGQRQRLALARAILHNSSVYIFDEATSNIDAESENDIIEQIYALAKDKTVILITHRLANAKNADNIYALQNGTVAEFGRHKKLLKQNGLYKSLWQAQSGLESFAMEETA